MADEFYVWGESISLDSITTAGLREVVRALPHFPFADLVQVQSDAGKEVLILDFQVERSQAPTTPIEYRERIALCIDPNTGEPEAYALRRRFPETPHQFLTYKDAPKRLCLFEEPFRDLQHQLTPIRILQRISDWLARAATDTLHLNDQPLEPFTFSFGTLIADPHIIEKSKAQHESVVLIQLSKTPLLLEAKATSDNRKLYDGLQTAPYLLLPITTAPYHARLIQFMPRNLAELHELLSPVAVNLMGEIEKRIQTLVHDKVFDAFKSYYLILFVRIPKKRTENGKIETQETRVFLVTNTLEEIATKLEIMGKAPDTDFLGVLLKPKASSRQAPDIPVMTLRYITPLDRSLAQALSGRSTPTTRFVAIGAGALGSQTILNLARQGIGQWSLIDNDLLLPHNLERHASLPGFVGHNKANILAFFITGMLNDPSAANAFPIDFLDIEAYSKELASAMKSSQYILDFSASHTITRELANRDLPAPRLCAFLGPGGRSLFILAEAPDRSLKLDDLDMERAAWIVRNLELHTLYQVSHDMVQYSHSCRDLSGQIPQDMVAIFSGIAAHFVQKHIVEPQPGLHIWRWNDDTQSITHFQEQPERLLVQHCSGWTLRVSSNVVCFMADQRRLRLPNETGGVLLGQFDWPRRTAYVVAALSSPVDSVEWPTLYIRGVEGLLQKVEDYAKLSGGDVYYVGEWHSHPVGHGIDPSGDDLRALSILAREMSTEGLPAIMAIQGDSEVPNFLLSEFE